MSPQYERLNDWINQLQANKHPDIPPLDDPAEAELFIEASQWMGERPGADEPDPAFLANLRGQLFGDATPAAGQAPGGGANAPLVQTPAPPAPTPAPTPLPVGRAPVQVTAVPERSAVGEPPADPRVIQPGVWERRVSRRNLLSAMSAMAAGLVGGLGLESWLSRQEVVAAKSEAAEAKAELEVLRKSNGTTSVPPGDLGSGQGKWFAVASIEDVKIGEAIPITMGGVRGLLLRTGENTFNALSGICTHLGCELGWDTGSHHFVCGCHGSSFDTTGKPLTGPALYMGPLRDLPIFSWKIQDSIVYVLA
jgi:Rieske Fe-S protein